MYIFRGRRSDAFLLIQNKKMLYVAKLGGVLF